MAASIITIASAIVTALNGVGTPLSGGVTAARSYVPGFDEKELKTARVIVAPRGIEISQLSRAEHAHDYTIDVGVMKKVTVPTTDADALMELTEQVADFLRGKTMGDAAWLSTQMDPIFGERELDEMRVFIGVIKLTYRIAR